MRASQGDDGTLSFQMYFPNEGVEGVDGTCTDQSTCHLIEHYQNSAAAAAHIRSMQKNRYRNRAIHDCADIICLEVYGAASAELKQLLSEEEYSVVYLGPSGIGLTRAGSKG